MRYARQINVYSLDAASRGVYGMDTAMRSVSGRIGKSMGHVWAAVAWR